MKRRRSKMDAKLPIYLDNHATTRTDPQVVETMLPYFTEDYGNPSSATHVYGWRASEAVELAREKIAASLGVRDAREVIFTSGGTESNNLAIQGIARALVKRGNHLVTQATEHPSVMEVFRALEKQGFTTTILPVDRDGCVSPGSVREALTERTTLVSIMLANHEIGTLQPIAEIGALCREQGVVLHCDGVQAVGKLPVALDALPVDLFSFSGHKCYGPKGVGGLYVRDRRPRLRLVPLIFGGPQEREMRPGTIAVPLVVGFAKALELCVADLESESGRIGRLRDALWRTLSTELDDVFLNGSPEARLPGNLSVSFGGIDGEKMFLALRELALSSGSACSSALGKASHVLTALGVSEPLAKATLRFGLGRFTREEEVVRAGKIVVETVRRLRGDASGASPRASA